MATTWEYTYVRRSGMDRLLLELNALGSVGWELIDLDREELGLAGTYVALLKRPARRYPDAGTEEPGWFRDPTGRFRQRYWDGRWWTEHVSDGSVGAEAEVDWPNVR